MEQPDITQLIKKAEEFLLAGNLDSTEGIVSKILLFDNKQIDAWTLKAKLNLKKNKLSEAADGFKVVLRLKPNSEEAVVNLVRYYGIKKDFEECKTILLNAIAAEPSFARYPFMLSKIFLEQGYHAKAIKHMESARQLSPSNLKIIIALSEIYGKHGNLDKSLDVIQPLLEASPPYFPAVMIFVNLSPALNMVDDCMALLDRLSCLTLPPEQTIELETSKKILLKTRIDFSPSA
jgi:tetratricopeptide (TPR) repeat protein